MPEFVERLIEALDPYFDVPFAFFGHSLGALAAHELALALERKERAAPKRLFASAHRAPSLPQRRPPIHAQSDDEMIESLRALGGTPSAVFEDRELIELFLPTFRADFKMTETHQSGPLAPLRCPITALGGTHDDRVDEEELGAWSRHTARGFDCRVFDGGHFYLKEYERDVLGSITLRLDAVNGDESRSA